MKSKYIIFILILLLTSCSSKDESFDSGEGVKALEIEQSNVNKEIEILQSQVDDQAALIATLTEDKLRLTDELNEVRRMSTEFDRWNYEINFINGNQDRMTLTYYVAKSEEDAQVVNIIGSNFTAQGESYTSERIEIKGLGEHEHVKFIIFGDVYDFGLYRLKYSNSDYKEAERALVEDLGDLSNIEIIVETTLPEGLPGEVIRWKDVEGNLYEEFLSYDGLGASGKIRISYGTDEY